MSREGKDTNGNARTCLPGHQLCDITSMPPSITPPRSTPPPPQVTLVAESTSGALLSAEVAAAKAQLPEDVGAEAAAALLEQV